MVRLVLVVKFSLTSHSESLPKTVVDDLDSALKRLSETSEWSKSECNPRPASRLVLSESIIRVRVQIAIMQSQRSMDDKVVLDILEEARDLSFDTLRVALQVLIGSKSSFTMYGVLRFTKLVCPVMDSIPPEACVLTMDHLTDVVCNNVLEAEKPHQKDLGAIYELLKRFLELLHSRRFKYPDDPQVADSSLRLHGALFCFMYFHGDAHKLGLDSMMVRWQKMLRLCLEERSVCNTCFMGF